MRGSIAPARTALGRQGKQWYAILDLGPGPDGKRQQKWFRVDGSKRDAQRELTRLLREQDTGGVVDPSKMSVGDFLQKWLTDCAKTRTAPQTFLRYEAIVKTHLIPQLGQHPLAKLTPMDVATYYRTALESGRRHPKPKPGEPPAGLAASTVAFHAQLLRDALAQAVKWRLIPFSPAQDVEPPRARPQEVQALTAEQSMLLLAGAQGDKLFAPIVLALGCGLRKGEVFAVRWGDVDLDAARLWVRRSLQERGLGFKEPKTLHGRRMVDLPAFVVTALRMHQQAQAQERALCGPDYRDGDLVCAMPDGDPVRYNVTVAFHALMGRLKLPDVSFKALRHTHATLLLADGENPRVVSERLGHSDIKVTLGVYVHCLPGAQQQAAGRMDALLKGSG